LQIAKDGFGTRVEGLNVRRGDRTVLTIELQPENTGTVASLLLWLWCGLVMTNVIAGVLGVCHTTRRSTAAADSAGTAWGDGWPPNQLGG
jgi:hypothetical protein